MLSLDSMLRGTLHAGLPLFALEPAFLQIMDSYFSLHQEQFVDTYMSGRHRTMTYFALQSDFSNCIETNSDVQVSVGEYVSEQGEKLYQSVYDQIANSTSKK